MTVHAGLVDLHGVLLVAAATLFALTSLTAHLPKPVFLPVSLNNLHHLQTDAIFMDPYKTSYRTRFPLPLTTNFDMTKFDRESHLEGEVIILQLFVSKPIHPLIYGAATPSGPWPLSEDAYILL